MDCSRIVSVRVAVAASLLIMPNAANGNLFIEELVVVWMMCVGAKLAAKGAVAAIRTNVVIECNEFFPIAIFACSYNVF